MSVARKGASRRAQGKGRRRELLTLAEADRLVKSGAPSFKYTFADAILFLLYADRRPIRGRFRQQKEIFLALHLVLDKMPIQRCDFVKHRLGPYCEEVDSTIDSLAFSNFVEASGSRSSREFSLRITPAGMSHIKDKFDSLPQYVRSRLESSRKEWDAHTTRDMLNVVHAHFPEYRKGR